ncbi:MAG: class I SAM-dependent methyltransferase [Sedimentisphaerales bacterium]|nr:class I SAM-dependent methyltransferase [Sedimentisphaerales bacterium]
MLKSGVRIIRKKDLNYRIDGQGRIVRFRPWLGDSFSFLYDTIMKNSIFPRKFGGQMSIHYDILTQELKGVHDKRVLELAAGSGSAVNFLAKDNHYTGTDISPGLLKRAARNFKTAGFEDAKFYVVNADELPFDNNVFDLCLCILSLNFFSDARKVFQEIKRVLVPGAVFICSVPVPERNKRQNTIRGTLYSEEELKTICREYSLKFESIPAENGALLYFRAFL